MQITINVIRKFFETYQRKIIDDETLTRAGVLIPIFENYNELHLILTQRTDKVEHHKGQISFPGGAKDAADESIIKTALREAEEEIGLNRKIVEVLGVLDDYRTPSGFCITPVVGFLKYYPKLKLNNAEVLETFNVPLSFFQKTENEQTEKHEINEKTLTVYIYNYGKFKIWGATAAIIRGFIMQFGQSFVVSTD